MYKAICVMSPPKVSYLPISKSERTFKQKLGAGLKVWGGNQISIARLIVVIEQNIHVS